VDHLHAAADLAAHDSEQGTELIPGLAEDLPRIFVVLMSALTDIAFALIDPRIRIS
jgi:hypothetical protein